MCQAYLRFFVCSLHAFLKTAIIITLYLASFFSPLYLLLTSLCSVFLQCLLPALRFSFILSLSLLPIGVLTFVLVSNSALEGAAVTYTC